MRLLSDAFGANSNMPQRYTCEGDGISPDLKWDEPPIETQSLVLLVEDLGKSEQEIPEEGRFVQWVMYNIAPITREIPTDVSPNEPLLEGGATQGVNSNGSLGYTPICPESDFHRYSFRLYALDGSLGLEAGATREEVEAAMAGHVIASSELIGCYKRQGLRASGGVYHSQTD